MRDVADQTGLPAATIRAWERRYGYPDPVRTAGGHRRYGQSDIEGLRKAAELVDEGWSAGTAVRHVRDLDKGAPATSPVIVDVTAAPTNPDVDVEALALVARTLRTIVRATRPESVVAALLEAVERLGGEIIDAEDDDGSAIPIDLSLGVGAPLLPTADAFTLSRMRLEAVLPELVEDARVVAERLRTRAV